MKSLIMDGHSSEIIEIPIFPLWDVVFFPGTVIPLHIFEPRYRKMVADSLNRDRRIGIILANAHGDHLSEPRVSEVGGLGLITDYQEREEGEYDILLRGVSRFEVLEIVSETPYRVARVKILTGASLAEPGDLTLRKTLVRRYRELAGSDHKVVDEEVLDEGDFETLVNTVGSALPISADEKQELLETDNVRDRAEKIVELVGNLLAHKEFVEGFSHLRPKDPIVN